MRQAFGKDRRDGLAEHLSGVVANGARDVQRQGTVTIGDKPPDEAGTAGSRRMVCEALPVGRDTFDSRRVAAVRDDAAGVGDRQFHDLFGYQRRPLAPNGEREVFAGGTVVSD